ncbi:uncharacterized protein LOC129805772 [Phlebotomus papatasi]|uniref:uncharacterized protein LOC129805772 n=1 Tax=Phlebotomus papatasi TaxID=29031 RepID=UPI002483F930|nr:uncharacterized protein LOC129805772 [Phlebotomus papatasi]
MDKFLEQAIDTTFLNDAMFKNFGNKHEKEETKGLKSERYLPEAEEVDKELPVTESMQKFMSKKLSDLVAKQTYFVEESPRKKVSASPNDSGIRLLKDSQVYVKEENISNEQMELPRAPKKKKKPKISDELTENEKVQQSAICPDIILNQEDIRHWDTKTKGKIFHYREKKSKLYLQEPENEFTKIRKKNNWDESKIAKYKRKP